MRLFIASPPSHLLNVQNSYNELGTLIKKDLHSTNNGTSFLQSVDYSYNIRGWMTKINDPAAPGNDLFAMQLSYDQTISPSSGGAAQYNGNIAEQLFRTTGGTQYMYGYQYDQLNQLKKAQFSNNTYNEEMTYDLNGNIKTMQRMSTTMVDNLGYSYKGNMLMGVDDAVGTTAMAGDFEDKGSVYSAASPEYTYDVNGSMTSDKNKGITSIKYNYLNLPEEVKFSNSRRITWAYTSTGAKLRKTVDSAGIVRLTIDYVSGFVYKNQSLDFFGTEAGRVKKKSNGSLQYQYNLTDHLGNVRVTFADTNATADGAADMIEYSSYYAFGMRIEGTGLSSSSLDNKFTYNGKELEDDFGLAWYHYGARFYDAQLGMWHVIDGIDEFHSPYCFVGNNPIAFKDINGMGGDPIFDVAIRLIDKKYGDAQLEGAWKYWQYEQKATMIACNQFVWYVLQNLGVPAPQALFGQRSFFGSEGGAYYFRQNTTDNPNAVNLGSFRYGDIVGWGNTQLGNADRANNNHTVVISSALEVVDGYEGYYIWDSHLDFREGDQAIGDPGVSFRFVLKDFFSGRQDLYVARVVMPLFERMQSIESMSPRGVGDLSVRLLDIDTSEIPQ